MVSVVAACAWWVGASPVCSEEGIRDERELGATIIHINHRDYAVEYMAEFMWGRGLHAEDRQEEIAIRACKQVTLVYDTLKLSGEAVAFALCMKTNYPH